MEKVTILNVHESDDGKGSITLSDKTEVWFNHDWSPYDKEKALQVAQTICNALNNEPQPLLAKPQPDRLTMAAQLMSGLLNGFYVPNLNTQQIESAATVSLSCADELIAQSQKSSS